MGVIVAGVGIGAAVLTGVWALSVAGCVIALGVYDRKAQDEPFDSPNYHIYWKKSRTCVDIAARILTLGIACSEDFLH